MRPLIISLFISLIVSALCTSTQAQQFDLGIGAGYGIPMGDFDEALESTPVGLNLFGAIKLGDLPLKGGFELGILNYGSDKRREDFNDQIPDVQVEVFRTYNILTGNLFLRYEIPAGDRFTPYIDAVGGINYLFTKTSVRQADSPAAFATSINRDDAGFTYGGGAGIAFNAFRISDKIVKVYINGRYLLGSELTYLNDGELIVQNGTVSELTTTSDTDLIVVNAGLTIDF